MRRTRFHGHVELGYKIRVAANTENGREVAEFSNIATQENDPLWMLIRYPFAGKGSPEGIQAALQLAATDGPGESAIVSPANLQGYCDDLLATGLSGVSYGTEFKACPGLTSRPQRIL